MLCSWGRTSQVFIYGGMRDRSMRSGTKLVRDWIQLTDWSTAGNLSNRSSGVQIPRDICTRFVRYLYSTRCSWIIRSDYNQLALRARWLFYQFISNAGSWNNCYFERFSFECRKVIGSVFTTLRDWLKRFAPLFHPIRSKTKTNCVIASRASLQLHVTCNYFEFWLVHCIVCVLCDWLEQLLWFWFYDTQMKTALLFNKL